MWRSAVLMMREDSDPRRVRWDCAGRSEHVKSIEATQTTPITVLLGEQNVTFALPHADRVVLNIPDRLGSIRAVSA